MDSQGIRIQMSSGVTVRARGWTLAAMTFVAQPDASPEAEALTVELYFLTTQAVMIRIYHRAEPVDGSTLPVRVWMDVTARCGTLDSAIEFLSGLGWPAPMADQVREEAYLRWERLVFQGEMMRPRTGTPPHVHNTPTSGFAVLAGSTLPK